MHGDCLIKMASMPNNSVDLILTDPPYYSTALKFDKAERLDYGVWLAECKRILKPSGVLVSFCDLNLLIELKSKKIFKSSYEIIWKKTSAVGFLSSNLRPLMAHEYMCVFTDALKKSTYNPQKTAGKPYTANRTVQPAIYNKCRSNTVNNLGDRHPHSVIEFKKDYKPQHPTQKPLELCKWLINTYSNENELVLDPFQGGGSTGVAAKLLNRQFIGVELDAGYFEIAKNRIDAA